MLFVDKFNAKFKYSSSQEHSPLCESSNTKRFLNFSECCEDGNSPSSFVSIGKKPLVLVVELACYGLCLIRDIGKERFLT